VRGGPHHTRLSRTWPVLCALPLHGPPAAAAFAGRRSALSRGTHAARPGLGLAIFDRTAPRPREPLGAATPGATPPLAIPFTNICPRACALPPSVRCGPGAPLPPRLGRLAAHPCSSSNSRLLGAYPLTPQCTCPRRPAPHSQRRGPPLTVAGPALRFRGPRGDRATHCPTPLPAVHAARAPPNARGPRAAPGMLTPGRPPEARPCTPPHCHVETHFPLCFAHPAVFFPKRGRAISSNERERRAAAARRRGFAPTRASRRGAGGQGRSMPDPGTQTFLSRASAREGAAHRRGGGRPRPARSAAGRPRCERGLPFHSTGALVSSCEPRGMDEPPRVGAGGSVPGTLPGGFAACRGGQGVEGGRRRQRLHTQHWHCADDCAKVRADTNRLGDLCSDPLHGASGSPRHPPRSATRFPTSATACHLCLAVSDGYRA
jgi:hypothetical protein